MPSILYADLQSACLIGTTCWQRWSVQSVLCVICLSGRGELAEQSLFGRYCVLCDRCIRLVSWHETWCPVTPKIARYTWKECLSKTGVNKHVMRCWLEFTDISLLCEKLHFSCWYKCCNTYNAYLLEPIHKSLKNRPSSCYPWCITWINVVRGWSDSIILPYHLDILESGLWGKCRDMNLLVDIENWELQIIDILMAV